MARMVLWYQRLLYFLILQTLVLIYDHSLKAKFFFKKKIKLQNLITKFELRKFLSKLHAENKFPKKTSKQFAVGTHCLFIHAFFIFIF